MKLLCNITQDQIITHRISLYNNNILYTGYDNDASVLTYVFNILLCVINIGMSVFYISQERTSNTTLIILLSVVPLLYIVVWFLILNRLHNLYSYIYIAKDGNLKDDITKKEQHNIIYIGFTLLGINILIFILLIYIILESIGKLTKIYIIMMIITSIISTLYILIYLFLYKLIIGSNINNKNKTKYNQQHGYRIEKKRDNYLIYTFNGEIHNLIL